ncbi:MAG: hypothetical protein LBB89_13880 [Treponema sp.]|jgi:NADH/NAD ratio-sensing transcriptional regulator Rex|nr:hypothetical protein [Treponema sp.]
MSGWDVLSNFINGFPSIIATLMLVVAGIIFIIGFSRYGYNFLKYGFKQTEITDLGAKIDQLRTEFRTELETIKVNHFGHLKNFLTELTSILVDKGIINNENKARLDNHLRGM